MIRGLLPLSADGIHYGHLDIIRRAAAECDELLVAVLDNDEKRASYAFPLPERARMAERAIQHCIGQDSGALIRVVSSPDLLVDLFLREGCNVVFRGIRDRKDEEYESWQMALHEVLLPGFRDKVRYLPANPKFRHISSTALKAFVMHGADTSSMCPIFVKSKLERTLRNLYLVGVTGAMGVGKSWVCEQVVAEFTREGISAHHINVDALLRDLYAEDSPGAQQVRDGILSMTGAEITVVAGKADLSALKAKIASGDLAPDILQQMHNLTEPHVYRLLRAALRGKRGLVLVEWARLIEDGMTRLANNDAIIVTSPNQEEFLANRGVDPAFAARLLANQVPVGVKEHLLRERLNEDGCGSTIVHENTQGSTVEILTRRLLRLFPMLGSA